VVRLPPKLHASLKRRAGEQGVSLNAYCLAALQNNEGSGSEWNAHRGGLVDQVRRLLGESLSGVLLFGSEARGEERQSSDRDLLIVVNNDLQLTRALYARWDQGIEGAATSRLSPHYVHLAVDEDGAGSLWYEAAIDGIVLFDRDGGIARLLRVLRTSMAEGKLQRKMAYGHPYWIKRGREAARVQ
jgi:predicted nucleotidyltransferase